MTVLSPEAEADLKAMEADYQKPATPLGPGEKVRPERFSDFAPGMSDEGELFEVPAPAPVPAPKKP